MYIKQRSIPLCILFTLLTCGIYGIYWMVVLTDESNALAPQNRTASGASAVLYTLLTCGIYSFFWVYKLGEKLDEINARNGQPNKNQGMLFLLLSACGLSIISFCIAQNTLNDHANVF